MRRLLATLLSISLILQMAIFFTLAEDTEQEKYYAGMGDYTVTRKQILSPILHLPSSEPLPPTAGFGWTRV